MARQDKDWRPRLSIELSEDQYMRLQKNLPWGTKQNLFSRLVDEVNILVETYGSAALGAIFSGDLVIAPRGGRHEDRGL